MKNVTTCKNALVLAAGITGLAITSSAQTTTSEVIRLNATGDIRSNNYTFHAGDAIDQNDEFYRPKISWDIQHDFATREGKTIRVVSPARMKIYCVGMGFGPVSNPFVVRADYKLNDGAWRELHYRDPVTKNSEPDASTPYVDMEVREGTTIDFRAKGWNNSGRNAPLGSNWWTRLAAADIPGVRSWRTRQTDARHPVLPEENVQLLRRGEVVGDWTPAFDQGAVGEFLELYINPINNQVIVGPQDFIYLFELSEANDRPDMQDCVIVVEFSPIEEATN